MIKEIETMTQTLVIRPLHLSNDLWDEEVQQQAYYTVRYYNASGIGVEQERMNVLASSEQEAKDIFCSTYRVFQGSMYRLYAFLQEGRI